MIERIKQMIIKEFIQIFRDRRMKAVIFITPILQLLMFGYAVTTDISSISTAFYDLDNSYESREIARRLESSGYFNILHRPGTPGRIRDLIDSGEAVCAIQINRGLSKDLIKGETAELQIIVDGTDSNTAAVAMDYANRVIAQYVRETQNQKVRIKPVTIDLRTRAWYNPDLRSRNYNVPGVIAMIIMLTCLLLTSMAVVREREIGTMEQLMVTPLRSMELILGKTIPFALIGFFDVFLVTMVGVFWFDIPVKGSLILLTGSTAVYLLSVLGIGLFISTISKTQQQAMMATFLFYIPAILLSGFMFPVKNMPEIVQYATYINPLRYFLVIIRGIFLKGNGIDVLWPHIMSLLVLGLLVIVISALRFQKRLT